MERDLSFDYLKGILIYLVVLGHSISWFCETYTQNFVYNLIYSFHMPLFVAISGYFSLSSINNTFLVTLKKKTTRLIFPIICWSLIFFLFDLFVKHKNITFYLYYTELRKVWYLVCIFALTILFNLIWKCKYKKALTIATIIISFTVLYNYIPIDVLIHFQIIRQMPFFLGGILLATNQLWYQRISSRHILILSVSIFLIWLLLFRLNPSNYSINRINYIIREFIYLSASILMFNLLRKTYFSMLNAQCTKWILLIGRNSLGIYLLNSILLDVIKLNISKPYIINPIYILLISIVVTYLCYRITLLFNLNTTLKKYLLGEK